jgi:hypothetical protein
MKTKTFVQDSADADLKGSFAAKRARIGARQGLLLDYLTNRMGGRAYLSTDDLADKVAGRDNELYYRLEQLRLLGFVNKTNLSAPGGDPSFGWSLSEKYRREIGR